jgi:hypothetical protein
MKVSLNFIWIELRIILTTDNSGQSRFIGNAPVARAAKGNTGGKTNESGM